MERKIGETFEYEGKILQVKASVRKYSCIGCIFGRKCSSRTKLVSGVCGNGRREDGNDVIFVEVAKEQSQDEQPQELNLCEILKDCPQSEPFWSPLLGDVKFHDINQKRNFIVISLENGETWDINADGTITIGDVTSPEIMLYPSREQRDWTKVKYEPKKEKFDRNSLQQVDRVLVRDDKDIAWKINIYSHKYYNTSHPYRRITSIYIYCIPYYDDTKHLAGTKDDVPASYR